jgi:hypothetical protein
MPRMPGCFIRLNPKTMKTVNKVLYKELMNLAGFEATRENIEAPMDQLNYNGKMINNHLHKLGIKTQQQVDLLEETLMDLLSLHKENINENLKYGLTRYLDNELTKRRRY